MSSAKWRPFCLGLNVLMSVWSLFSTGIVIIAALYAKELPTNSSNGNSETCL